MYNLHLQGQDISKSKKMLQGIRWRRPDAGRGWGYQVAFLTAAHGLSALTPASISHAHVIARTVMLEYGGGQGPIEAG